MIVMSRPSIGSKILSDIAEKRKQGRVPEYIVVSPAEADELFSHPEFISWNYYTMPDADARNILCRDFEPTSGVPLAKHKVRMNQYHRTAEIGRFAGIPVYIVPLTHHPLKDDA